MADTINLAKLIFDDTTGNLKRYTDGEYVHLEYYNPNYDYINLEVETVLETLDDFSLANATLTNKVLWRPTYTGLFIGAISASFTANNTGVRYLNAVSLNNDDITNWTSLGARQRVDAASSGETHLSASIAIKIDDLDYSIGARLYQNRGSALTVKDLNIYGIYIKK